MKPAEAILTVIGTTRDGRGNDVSLRRHDEYFNAVYDLAYTDERGEPVISVLYWTIDEARREMRKLTGKRTSEEIAALKENWENDPCYDLEDVPGFEAHREELLAFRLESEKQWASARREELLSKARSIGCPENLKLARFVESLEDRLEAVEADLSRLSERLWKLERRS